MRRHSTLFRLVASLVVGAVAGYGTALALGVADLYLSGHAAGALGGPMLDFGPLGVHLSLADVVLLIAVLLAAGITWTELGGPR
jgi:hypothetical protein